MALAASLSTSDLLPLGELWKFHRGITRPFFTRERITDFDIYERKSTIALQTSHTLILEGHSIDVQVSESYLFRFNVLKTKIKDWINRFTLDVATEFLCGSSVDSLSAGLSYPKASGKQNSSDFLEHPSNTFVEAFVEGLRLASHRTAFGDEWRLVEFTRDKVQPLRNIIDEFARPVMDRVVSEWEAKTKGLEKEEDAEEPNTLLEYLVSQTQGALQWLDPYIHG